MHTIGSLLIAYRPGSAAVRLVQRELVSRWLRPNGCRKAAVGRYGHLKGHLGGSLSRLGRGRTQAKQGELDILNPRIALLAGCLFAVVLNLSPTLVAALCRQ